MKGQFSNAAFVGTGFALLIILFLRITNGLDLTDEMQYYGEIRGLLDTGRLFSSDLYIQQTVYLLLYPAFYLHHLLFGADGLVLFGRSLLALLIGVVFVYSYRKMLGFGFSVGVASATALALTFAAPYHGIFSPSYNTIAQLLWVIFMLRFFEWKAWHAWTLSGVMVVTALVHPTSGAAMLLLVSTRLLSERRYSQLFELFLKSAAAGMLVLVVALRFASVQEYRAALEFSSGYGVGETFFSTRAQPMALIMICALFGAGLLFWQRIRANYFLLVGSLVAITFLLFVYGYAGGAFSLRVVYVLSLIGAMAYVWSLSNTSPEDVQERGRINWLAAALLAYAATLAVTSGNGLPQSTGALMVGVPLLLGVALSSDPGKRKSQHSRLTTSIAFLIAVMFAVLCASYPYREDFLWRTHARADSVPEFRYISTSDARAGFLQGMQDAIGKTVQGKRTLIISSYPALYFALGAVPETCMLFMHSLPRGKAENALRNCMEHRSPETVVDIFEPGGMVPEHSYIREVMQDYYLQRGFVCKETSIEFGSVTKYNPARLNNRVCATTREQS